MALRVWSYLFVVFCLIALRCSSSDGDKEHVLTLDQSNFTLTVARHDFIVVHFYQPWCSNCTKISQEYVRAASVLSSHDPPLILAKIDAKDDKNKRLVGDYNIQDFPTVKIFINRGRLIQDYKGRWDAESIVDYLKKQYGSASSKTKSPKVIKAVFHDKWKSTGNLVLDTILNCSKEQGEEAREALVPFARDGQAFAPKLENFTSRATLLVTHKLADAFKSKYLEVAELFKGQGIRFKWNQIGPCQHIYGYYRLRYGLKADQAPLIIIETDDLKKKYIKTHLEPYEISSWVKEYTEGNLVPFKMSRPIPETNYKSVKVVVGDSFKDMVVDSGKDVFLELYSGPCMSKYCAKLDRVLNKVAATFRTDAGILVAKVDIFFNDIPIDTSGVRKYPILYFRSASGSLSRYDGDHTKEAIIEFIHTNRSTSPYRSFSE